MHKTVKTKNRYIPSMQAKLAISGHPRVIAIRVNMEVHSMGPDILCTFLK
jgi:hypothetical protein